MLRGFKVVKDEYRKNEGAIQLPEKATKGAGAYDFYSPIDITIQPHKMVMIWTDVKAYMQLGEILVINVRSSMGKQPIMIANTQGWIDKDYYENEDNDGNIGFRLFNMGDTPYSIKKGERIGQGMFIASLPANNGNTENKRTGGFGSTGK